MEFSIFNLALGFSVLALIYVLLSFEILHRTAAALIGASVIIVANIFLRFSSFEELLKSVDMDTIFLLMSMMIMVSVLSETGVFGYIAFKITSKFLKSPFKLILVLTGFTAAISAFIDNVTTVLLVSPIVIEIFRRLRVDPRPILILIAFASNIGGTATLIGDPPNIIIGSMARLGFMEFIWNLTPVVVLDFIFFIILARFMCKNWLKNYAKHVGTRSSIFEGKVSVDKSLLRKVSLALTIAITLFFLEDILEYPPAIAAMIGVGVLLTLTRREISIEKMLSSVDWTTLVFFMAMFIVIKGVEDLGVMRFLAYSLSSITHDFIGLMMLILWVSAFTSAFIDNIPFVLSMVPVIQLISQTTYLHEITPLYWALSLGGCLGGNGTLIGASANIVVAGVSERYGYHISFNYFLKYGMPTMVTTVAISALYLIVRYGI